MSEKPLEKKYPRAYERGAQQAGETPSTDIRTMESRAEAIPTTGIFTQRDTREHLSANQREAINELRRREQEQYSHSHPEGAKDRKKIIEGEK